MNIFILLREINIFSIIPFHYIELKKIIQNLF